MSNAIQMTGFQVFVTVAMVVLGTMLTRFLPFLVFPSGKPAPAYVRYLGKALTGAALGMLVVYCFKDVNLLTGAHGLPELVSLTAIIALHLWKRNMLLSIAAGTAVYMLLVNFVFV